MFHDCKPQLEEMADSGDVFAAYTLGICYCNETDENKDFLYGFQRLLDAATGNFYRSFCSIALIYFSGVDITKDLQTALLWAKKAMQFPQCIGALKIAADIQCDMEEYTDSFKLYIKCAELGCKNVYNVLGWMHAEGKGVKENPEKGVEYFEKAAEAGDRNGEFNLACCYLNGIGVPANRKKAKYWLEKSASQGYQDAIDILKETFG